MYQYILSSQNAHAIISEPIDSDKSCLPRQVIWIILPLYDIHNYLWLFKAMGIKIFPSVLHLVSFSSLSLSFIPISATPSSASLFPVQSQASCCPNILVIGHGKSCLRKLAGPMCQPRCSVLRTSSIRTDREEGNKVWRTPCSVVKTCMVRAEAIWSSSPMCALSPQSVGSPHLISWNPVDTTCILHTSPPHNYNWHS